jgi:tungstate transport system permease protein
MTALSDALTLLATADAALWAIIWVSLKTSFLSLLLATPPALVADYLVATRNLRGRRIVLWLAQAALSLPTVLIGLLLYFLLARQGAFGQLHGLFSQPGIIAGQTIIALPVLLAFSLTAIRSLDPHLAETAITLGASEPRVMLTVLREARFGVMAAIINGFGRVISELGCALMVGGNIAGETRTITTTIVLETSKGEFTQGIAVGLVLMLLALFINALLMLLQGDFGSPPR